MLYDKQMLIELINEDVVKYIGDDIAMLAYIDEMGGKILPSVLDIKEFYDGKWFVFSDDCSAMNTAIKESGNEPDFVMYEEMLQAIVSPVYFQLKKKNSAYSVMGEHIPFIGTWEDATFNTQHRKALVDNKTDFPDCWSKSGAVIVPIAKVEDMETRKITYAKLKKILISHRQAVSRMAYAYYGICQSAGNF